MTGIVPPMDAARTDPANHVGEENEYEGESIALLDHGHLRLVETWGSDAQIIRAARQSTKKGFLGWGSDRLFCTDKRCMTVAPEGEVRSATCLRCGAPIAPPLPGDEKLLTYLWMNRHSTPFEVAGATFEIQAPIMVFREWHRHRVPFGYSEMSARYVPLPNENYVPTVQRLLGDGATTANKQAGTIKGVERISNANDANGWLAMLADAYERCEDVYQSGLALGVPKELARLIVPVGRYSRMWATGNVRGWLGFLALRDAPSAQEEIRVFAHALGDELAIRFPRTMKFFKESRP